MVKVETTCGPKMVPKKYVDITQTKLEAVTIKTKDGKSIPLVLKSLPVVFKKGLNASDVTNRKKVTIQKIDLPSSNLHFEQKFLNIDKKVFKSESILAKKIKKRLKSHRTIFICEHCGKRFPNENKYNEHLKYHSEKTVTCPTCNKMFKHPSTLQKHLNIHKGIKFICKLCGVAVASKNVLDIHVRRHNGQYTHKCEECGKEYYNSKSFNYHMESEHVGIRYPCEICGSVLKSKRYYKDHMLNHSNKNARTFKCNVCHKYYSTKSALNGHMRIHTGERYVCDICGKKSIQKGAHNSHMRMHNGEKSYICELCGKDFLRKDALDQHMRRVHEISKIPCKKCDDIFTTEHQLMVHLHTHDDVDKPFPCELCSEKFIDKNFLRSHVNKVHIEHKDDKICNAKKRQSTIKNNPKQKSYTCNDCEEVFDSVVPFICHKQIHVTRKSFSCNLCKNEFNNAEELNVHMQSHIGELDEVPSTDYIYELEDNSYDCERIITTEEETPYANHEVIVEDFVSF